MAGASAYPGPARAESPLEVARWRPLVHWFLAIPQLFVVYIVNSVLSMLAFFLVGVVRWSTRVSAYFYLMTDGYPAFSLEP